MISYTVKVVEQVEYEVLVEAEGEDEAQERAERLFLSNPNHFFTEVIERDFFVEEES